MRRKRLQHVADTLCHMACGWRVVGDRHELAKLGSGRIVIDVLTTECTLNGQAHEPFLIALELSDWIRRDLADNDIPIDAIRRAELTLDFTATVDAARLGVSFDRRCRTVVETDETRYASSFEKEDAYAL